MAFVVGRVPDCAAAPVTRITHLGPGQQADLGRGRPAHRPARLHRGRRAERLPGGHAVREAGRRRRRPARREPAAAGRRRGRGSPPTTSVSGKVTTYYEGAYHTFSRSGFQGGRRVQAAPAAGTNLLPDGQRRDDESG